MARAPPTLSTRYLLHKRLREEQLRISDTPIFSPRHSMRGCSHRKKSAEVGTAQLKSATPQLRNLRTTVLVAELRIGYLSQKSCGVASCGSENFKSATATDNRSSHAPMGRGRNGPLHFSFPWLKKRNKILLPNFSYPSSHQFYTL